MTEVEIWKDVLGYEGFYQVSNKGNIYSVARKDALGRKIGGRTLKPRYHKDGYLQVILCKNGIRKNKLIHRLVLETFVENPNNLPEVNHKDENKINNGLSNLEWCDTSYNNNHGTRNRRIGQTKSKKVRAVNVKTGEFITFNSAKEAISKGYSRVLYQACRGAYDDGKGNLLGDGHTYKGHRWYYE